MCGFFTSTIFDHPRLQNVKYYLRLDTDSFVEQPTCYDPFEVMYVRKRIYGYRDAGWDPEYVTHGLWNLTDAYARAHPAVEARLRDNAFPWPQARAKGDLVAMSKGEYPMYYNNFEIVDLEAFRRPDVKAWLDEVKSVPERTYKWRWGGFIPHSFLLSFDKHLIQLLVIFLRLCRGCAITICDRPNVL